MININNVKISFIKTYDGGTGGGSGRVAGAKSGRKSGGAKSKGNKSTKTRKRLALRKNNGQVDRRGITKINKTRKPAGFFTRVGRRIKKAIRGISKRVRKLVGRTRKVAKSKTMVGRGVQARKRLGIVL